MWENIKDFYRNAHKGWLIVMELLYVAIGVFNVVYLTANNFNLLISIIISVAFELIVHFIIIFSATQL